MAGARQGVTRTVPPAHTTAGAHVSTRSSRALALLVTAGLAGCDAGASTGPAHGGGGGATLDILLPAADVVIDEPVQLDARVVGMGDAAKVWKIGARGGTPQPFTSTKLSRDLAWAPGPRIVYQRPGNSAFHFLDPHDGQLTGRYYGAVTVRAEAGDLTAEAPLEVVAGAGYSRADLDYFQEVALGAEYGSSSRIVRKWGGDVLIKVHGTPSERDLEALAEVMDDLRRLMAGRRIEIVSEDANLDLHFAPESTFHEIDPNYEPTNYGFFWVWWGRDNQLVRSRVLISTTDISQDARSHLIREEITQSLGLMNDSWRYPESIYYQGWTRTTRYAPIDQIVIEMLYRDEIRPGMTEAQALAVLRELPRRLAPARVVSAG